MSLGSNVFVMVPKLPNVHAPVVELKLLQLKLPVGRKLVRFSTLNTSARNCSRIRSQGMRQVLFSEASICQNGSLRAMLRPALPNGLLGSVGTRMLSRLKKCAMWLLA